MPPGAGVAGARLRAAFAHRARARDRVGWCLRVAPPRRCGPERSRAVVIVPGPARVHAARAARAPATPAPGGREGAPPRTQKEHPMDRFASYEVSIELIRALRVVMPKIKQHDADLAKQIRRA